MALFLANLAFVIIGLLGAKYFARVTLTPQNILSVCVLNLSLIGCYGVRGNFRDVYAMLAFGVVRESQNVEFCKFRAESPMCTDL